MTRVYKLKTRYPTYSSFCIEVKEEDFEKLLEPRHWGQDVVLRRYTGRPRRENVLEMAE